MSMDQVPAGSSLEWRAIANRDAAQDALRIHHRDRILRRRPHSRRRVAAIAVAQGGGGAISTPQRISRIAGLALAVGLYLFGFMAVGGEWFQMWRSLPDSEQAAFRFIGCAALVMLFLGQRDD